MAQILQCAENSEYVPLECIKENIETLVPVLPWKIAQNEHKFKGQGLFYHQTSKS